MGYCYETKDRFENRKSGVGYTWTESEPRPFVDVEIPTSDEVSASCAASLQIANEHRGN